MRSLRRGEEERKIFVMTLNKRMYCKLQLKLSDGGLKRDFLHFHPHPGVGILFYHSPVELAAHKDAVGSPALYIFKNEF